MKQINLLSDEELVKAFSNGDENAIRELIARYKEKVFTTINMLVKDRYLAEDLFQDLFIKVIDTLRKSRYQEEGKFSGWLMRIAHNLCMDHFRRVKAKPVITTHDDRDLFATLSFASPAADHEITKRQRHDTIRRMIDLLPEEQREVIILRHYADMPFKDIAKHLKCSINTALGRMRYGLGNLRRIMNENELAF